MRDILNTHSTICVFFTDTLATKQVAVFIHFSFCKGQNRRTSCGGVGT